MLKVHVCMFSLLNFEIVKVSSRRMRDKREIPNQMKNTENKDVETSVMGEMPIPIKKTLLRSFKTKKCFCFLIWCTACSVDKLYAFGIF